MYGMINKAFKQMICGQYGVEAWGRISATAGVSASEFVSLDNYSDQVTYGLVAAASQVLAQQPDQLLRAFGNYWIGHAARDGYGELLRMTGRTLTEFLLNLDSMHARIGLSFPALRPPSFKCSEITERSLLLHYYSERRGLEPMILGLLDGLGAMFDVQLGVEHVASRAAGHDHEIFRLHME